jgi:phage tail protein X|tara:strand:+ start:1038 stop:1337 length:300 start_codon:yes stop_codon:yes gene_type:complete
MGRYSTIQTNITARGRRFKETTKYPDIPLSYNDIYVYTDEGDRFDILAQSYYKDPSLWWIISIANPQLTQMSMFPPLGVQIRIPTNIGGIISQFERFNA